MGKVKDEAPAVKASKPAPKSSGARNVGTRVTSFLANLLQGGLYKPTQGKNARLFTFLALSLTVLVGCWRLYETLNGWRSLGGRYGVPAALALVLLWVVYRLMNYPTFADFLIATEAEMNKVSWTSRDDLKRATAVVMVTVFVVSFFLFGVDWVWSSILQMLHILEFDGGGGFGSTG